MYICVIEKQNIACVIIHVENPNLNVACIQIYVKFQVIHIPMLNKLPINS